MDTGGSLTDWYFEKTVEAACRAGVDRATAYKRTVAQMGFADNPPGLTGTELAAWRFRQREKAGIATRISGRSGTQADGSFSTKIRELIRKHEALTRLSRAQDAPAKPEVTLIDWPPTGQVRITREARETIYSEINYRTARHHEPVETGGFLIADKTRYGLIIQATGPGEDSEHFPDSTSFTAREAQLIVGRDPHRLEIGGSWHNHPPPLGYKPANVDRPSDRDTAGRLVSIRLGRGNIDLLVLQRYDGMVRDYRQGTILPWVTTENPDGSWCCQRAKLEVFDI